jgi:hypothetical protein
MKYTVEMTTGGMINVPSFIQIGSGMQKFLWGDTRTDTQAHRQQGNFMTTFIFSK